VTGSGVAEATVWNALGQVAAGSSSSANWSSVYDPSGQWIGQYNSTGGYWWGEYVRLQGRVVAYNLGSGGYTVFLHKDLATTTHMATGPSGSVLQDQVFYPWGQSWQDVGTWQQQEFAGLDGEDPSTGFYGSLSRTYNPAPGRWFSPDPAGLAAADPSDPQTWNMYAYVRNNPTSMTDPSGLNPADCDPELGCPPQCDPIDPECTPAPVPIAPWGPPAQGGGGGGPISNPGLPGPSGAPGMPGVSGNAGFPSVGVPSIVCQIIPGLCTNNNTESGAPYPWWLFPPITMVVNGSAAQVPRTSGNAANEPSQQQVTHPGYATPQWCHGLGVAVAVSGGVGGVLGGAAVIPTPATPGLGLAALAMAGIVAIGGIWYADVCQ
jgi:RHS repeat-associated protein